LTLVLAKAGSNRVLQMPRRQNGK